MTDARINALIDPSMYHQDAQYHAEVARLRLMLRMIEMALKDEGVDQDVAERVVNRLVYGVPDPGAGYTRQQELRDRIKIAETSVVVTPWIRS